MTSSQAFQVSHAVFSSLPPKLDTVSHLVRAWKSGSPRHLFGPSATAISWAAKHLKFFPVANSTQSSSISRRSAAVTARITTYVSTVRIDTFVSQRLQHGGIFWCPPPHDYTGKDQQNLGAVYRTHLCDVCWWFVFQFLWLLLSLQGRRTASFCFCLFAERLVSVQGWN